jgi:hypothetical protein
MEQHGKLGERKQGGDGGERRQQYAERAEAARASADEARTRDPEPLESLIAKLKPPTPPN